MTGTTSLSVRRGQLKAAMTRFTNYIHSDSCDLMQIEIRRSKLEDVWNEFQQVQAAIEELGDETQNEKENFPYREEFEESYFKLVAEAEKLIKISKIKEKTEVINEAAGEVHSKNYEGITQPTVKLAALNIPSFTGKYDEWSSFHDIFMALIHTNKSLTAIQKFFYLRSSLSRDAENSIKCLETTAVNYDAAWTSLITRYNNKKILIQTHVKNIVDLQPLKDGSSAKLRILADTLNSNMKALEALGQQPSDWGPLLLYIICVKLDDESRREWEIKARKNDVPPVSELIQFIEDRFRILESIESSRNFNYKLTQSTVQRSDQVKSNNNTQRGQKYTTSFVSTTSVKCFVCNLAHTIYKCPTFITLSVAERIEKVTSLKLCKICLRKHDGRCMARYCFKCSRPHNTLLHLGEKKDSGTENVSGDVNRNNRPAATTSSTTAHAQNGCNSVLLATAVVRVIGQSGKSVLARVLLDSASMNNFVSTELVQSLSLKRKKISHIVNGIGETTQNITSSVFLRIQSRINDYQLNTESLVVPKITGDLPTKVITDNGQRPGNIVLADPSFNIPQRVDILIGAAHFFDIIGVKQYQPCSKGPVYKETKFGFVISGLVPGITSKKGTVTCVTKNIECDNQQCVGNILRQFWQLEENLTSVPVPYTIEEKSCVQHFNRTVARENGGRFIVQLPFRDSVTQLGKSYAIAKRRLLSMERRFRIDPVLKFEYVKFMQEYEKLNHMTYVGEEEIDIPGKMCYLAHHCVQNLNSQTTKLRVVFDASTKTETGLSLNDVLLKGPVLQDDLIYILTRFRTFNFVLTADVKKMYRQINVIEKDREFQRILWRENSDSPIKVYKLNTITYGTVPASYLATACLKKLSEVENVQNPKISKAVSCDFYMDDFLGGANTKAETVELREGLIKIMSSAGMELSKWASNDLKIIDDVVDNKQKSNDLHEINDTITKILGLYWNAKTDFFQFQIVNLDKNVVHAPITKRQILSDIASIFDPLGLVGPIVIRAKIILQSLWQARVEWCDPVSENIQREWLAYRNDLSSLNDLLIPRQITIKEKIDNLQIHGFSDASERAYGCCLYLRCSDSRGNHFSKLICAKSKVAPIKTLSLPRLELCAAQLLVKVATKIVPKMQLKISKSYYWSDSNVTLCWINSTSKKWTTFVAHRVGFIQEKTSVSEWFHVNSKDNPAVIISRGCCPKELSNCALWWHGPDWLSQTEKYWPTSKSNFDSSEINISELKSSTVTALSTSKDNSDIFKKYSSTKKMTRIVAYCLRFTNNSSKEKEKFTGTLRPVEIQRANIVLIKNIQKIYFLREVQQLYSNGHVQSNSKLFRLRPFLDKDGLVRVGGRLKHAAFISVFQRHPIVLPADNSFTQTLIREEHIKLMHGGPQAVLASVRENYWPLNGRNITRSVINKCVTCFRHRPIFVQPIMGDLPKERVEPGRAFIKCGIDFTGPFMVKAGLRKNSPASKAYMCVFICLSTRAVHFELVSALCTDAFICALNRFFYRRGKFSVIYSDNATNFVGANRQLKEWQNLFKTEEHKRKSGEFLSDMGIEWKFIPARSPHFGGLWEAGVKSMKYLLRRVLGDAYLFYEELLTVVTRAEACLNSRPLTQISSDPSDMVPLTPAHFLIGNPLIALPEADETLVPINCLNCWRRVSQYSQNLWKRWSREYLSQLQERSKWADEKGPRLKSVLWFF